MSITLRIKDCLENHEKYVVEMATFSDEELAKKIDLVHIQAEHAFRKRNTASLELLEIWRMQIIEARIYKAENNIPDAPNEIELAISHIETTVAKAEGREEIFNDDATPDKVQRPKIKEEDENQTSLF